MKTITLEVSDSVAAKVSGMTPEEKKSISKVIDRIVTNRRSLADIMHEASEQARKNGLTPEILEELLSKE